MATPETDSQPPRSPASWRHTVGIAQMVKRHPVPYRGHAAAMEQLTFRLDVVDQQGTHHPPVGVELRGHDIMGHIENGDWVELTENPDRHGRVKQFTNLSTGREVRRKFNILSG